MPASSTVHTSILSRFRTSSGTRIATCQVACDASLTTSGHISAHAYSLADIIEARDLKARRDTMRAKIEVIETRLLSARQSGKLAGLVGRADAANRFAKLGLAKQRLVIDTLVKVTVLPTGKRGAAFDPELIAVDWRS